MKKFFVNQLVIAALAVVAAFTSCDKDKDKDENGGSTVDEITAEKVENAADFSDVKTVKLMSYDGNESVEIASADFTDGGFTLDLPATVASKYPITYIFGDQRKDIPSNVTVSNKNAKILQGVGSIHGLNSDGEIIAHFHYMKEEGNTVYGTYWTYTDSDVIINGTETFEIDAYSKIYSLALKKGWNVVYASETETKAELKTTPISGLKWVGYRLDDEN